jgi:hypothetical protein
MKITKQKLSFLKKLKSTGKKIFSNLIIGGTLVYLFLFSIINSYAKSNFQSSKSIFKPLDWFSNANDEEKNTPKPLNILSISPTINEQLTNTPISSNKKTNVASQQTTANDSNNNQVECVGPDDKLFWTTIEECKNLNEKWGKPLDYMKNCSLGEYCGGGIKRMKLSECHEFICCQIGNTWQVVSSKSECAERQVDRYKKLSHSTLPLRGLHSL